MSRGELLVATKQPTAICERVITYNINRSIINIYILWLMAKTFSKLAVGYTCKNVRIKYYWTRRLLRLRLKNRRAVDVLENFPEVYGSAYGLNHLSRRVLASIARWNTPGRSFWTTSTCCRAGLSRLTTPRRNRTFGL